MSITQGDQSRRVGQATERLLRLTIWAIFFALSLAVTGCGPRGNPSAQVVATYTGGQITRQEISEFVHERLPLCLEHAVCPKHGLNHERCSPEDSCEGYCKLHEAMDSPELYKQVIQDLVTDEMAQQLAVTRKVDKRDEIKDALNHVDEAITIENLGTRVTEQARVPESEVARYYQEHQQQFPGRSLSEAKDEIRQRLAPEVEQQYLDQYIAELKRNATLTKNYDLLRKLDGEDRDSTLFTVHGERYTLGDFLREFAELPQSERDKYDTYEKRCALLDRMVERLLVVEGARDEARNPKSEKTYKRTRTLLLAQMVHYADVEAKLKVSDEEVKRYYQDNKLHFMSPDGIKVGYIRIQGGATADEQKRAKSRAEEVCKKLKSSPLGDATNFARLAREYSEDAERLKDGYLVDTWIPLVEQLWPLPPEILPVLQDLRVGDTTEPIPIFSDYLLFKVVAKRRSQIQRFEAVKEEARTEVEALKHQRMTADLEKKLMKQANLNINLAALNDMLRKEKDQRKRAGAATKSSPKPQIDALGGEE